MARSAHALTRPAPCALVAIAMSCAAAASCSGEGRPSARPTRKLPGVRFFGCDEVRQDGSCEMRPGESAALTIWVPDPPGATTTLHLADLLARPASVAVLGGRRFVQKIERLPVVLRVRQTRPDGGAAEWTLNIVAAAEIPAAMKESEVLRAGGEFDRSKALLVPLRAAGDVTTRAAALGGLARIAVAEGRFDDATRLFRQSILLRRESGAVASEILDRGALAYVAINLGDYAGVRAALAPIAELAHLYPTLAVLAGYYEGLAARGTSDHRRAVRILQAVLDEAERLDASPYWANTAEMLVATLGALGRTTDARALLAKVRERIPEGPICARADALDLAGRLTAELREGGDDAGTARRLVDEAAEIYRTRCQKPRRRAYNLALLGMLAVDDGDLARAGSLLAASRAAHASPGVPLHLIQLELAAAVASLGKRFGEAELAFRRLELTARLHDDRGTEWRGLVGRAAAFAAAGRLEDARAACSRAEDVLDRLHLQAPLGGGRESFLRHHEESASRLVDLLLRLGRVDDAVQAARRSRARALSSLAWPLRLDGATDEVRLRWYAALSAYNRDRAEERGQDPEAWGLSLEKLERQAARRQEAGARARRLLDEELARLGLPEAGERAARPVAKGDLILSFHPAGAGWVGFAEEQGRVTARRIGAVDAGAPPERLGGDLLGPYARQLERAERLHLAPFGALNAVEFHALPWRGRPLVATLPVAYRVDATRDLPDRVPRREALVVAPIGRLRTARPEASIAEDALVARGWTVRRLDDAAAIPRALASALAARPGWFHYSGHAEYAGIDGWESHLGGPASPLLTVGDIVALSDAPDGVVLAGCETAATPAADAGPVGLGLAQAFVLAGARWVAATTRPVRDAEAHAVIREFYARLAEQDGAGAAAALRSAQLAVMEREPEADWASFRVLVP
jgi:cellulose synthase operon protein C